VKGTRLKVQGQRYKVKGERDLILDAENLILVPGSWIPDIKTEKIIDCIEKLVTRNQHHF